MTKQEAITELNTFKIGAKSELGENALDMAIRALEESTDEYLPNGTLVINTNLYQFIKRVLVQNGTDGTLFYADNDVEVLGKIRAEIANQEKWLMSAGYNAYNVNIAFGAIKRAITESKE